MSDKFNKVMQGYQQFREKYVIEYKPLLEELASKGQSPEIMVIACCDSRVEPALLLQCDPGDLFVTRNVANIVPPYENDEAHHGTSAALEFAIRYLNIKDLIILGHSQCGGVQAFLNQADLGRNDFISNWVNLIQITSPVDDIDSCAKQSLINSYHNCLTFPWIKERFEKGELNIHLWFFEIKAGVLHAYKQDANQFNPL